MKKLAKWGMTIAVATVMIVGMVASVSLNNAYADTTVEYSTSAEDLEAIKTRALLKVTYLQLYRCFGRMQQSITPTADNQFDRYDSSTYFSSDALASDYLKFPFDTGDKNQASCPAFIMGWKNNWITNLWNKTGTYKGVMALNKDAVVPDDSWWNNLNERMGKFLTDIGYEKISEDDGSLGDRQCFYYTIKLSDHAQKNNNGYIPPTSAGNYTYDTIDYCVATDSNGNVKQDGTGIITLYGNTDYADHFDNGHLTNDSATITIWFGQNGRRVSDAPFFDTNDVDGSVYLQANIFGDSHSGGGLVLRDPGYSMGNYYLFPKYINKKTYDAVNAGTLDLGYSWWGWFDKGVFSSTVYYGSLMAPNGQITYSQLKSRMLEVLRKMQGDDSLGNYLFDGVEAHDYSPQKVSYKKKSQGGDDFLKYFLGDTTTYDYGKFNDAEKYLLYYTYLKDSDYYKTATSESDVNATHKQLVTWLNDDGTFTKKYIYNMDDTNAAKTRYVLASYSSMWDNTSTGDWDYIAAQLAAIDVEKAFSDPTITDPILDPDITPVDDGKTTNTSSCAGLNAAGSLSWVICPVLELAAGATQWMYGSIVEPFLAVESGMLNTNSGTYVGWKIFQNMANVLAIVLLLIVIFSQVTGIGIDNYGIKKILPKLIVGIVLINLSFIISQALVDISNIAGSTIKNLFDNLGQDVAIQAIEGESIANNSAFASTAGTVGVGMALAGVLIAFPGIGAAIGTAILPLLPGILLALLGAVLGMLVAVLLLFVLLTVRKIAVIVLVVISPLAFACYMLPNTKKIFDKWANFLKNMLLMYPICGLVIGGGNFVSKVILTSATDSNGNLSFVMALAGMLASIVPFFFVPTLLKGSMNVLGNIGSKLSNFGKNTSGKAKGLVAGTDRMKDMQKRAVMARNQRLFNRYKNLEDSGKKLSDYQKRRMNNARVAYNSAASEDIAAAAGGAMLKEGSTAYDAALAMQKSAVNKQELDNQIAVMADTTDNYDVDKMDAQLQALLSKTSALNHDDELKMKALMKQLTTKGGYGKKKLASALGNASTATRAQAAKFMSKDGDVASAVNKNMMVAQYMREVNNGQVAGNTDFNTWQQSNAQRVLTQVITSDTDFVNQSASAVSSQVDLLSDERLSAIVNNERVMDAADSDVRTAIIAAAKARNMDIPTRYGGVVQDTPQPIATPVQQAPIAGNGDPTTLNVQGGSNATGKPVEVKIEQPTPKLNVEQVVERMDSGSRQRMQTDGGIILNESPEVQRQLEREFRQKKDEADRKNGRNGGGIILPS